MTDSKRKRKGHRVVSGAVALGGRALHSPPRAPRDPFRLPFQAAIGECPRLYGSRARVGSTARAPALLFSLLNFFSEPRGSAGPASLEDPVTEDGPRRATKGHRAVTAAAFHGCGRASAVVGGVPQACGAPLGVRPRKRGPRLGGGAPTCSLPGRSRTVQEPLGGLVASAAGLAKRRVRPIQSAPIQWHGSTQPREAASLPFRDPRRRSSSASGDRGQQRACTRARCRWVSARTVGGPRRGLAAVGPRTGTARPMWLSRRTNQGQDWRGLRPVWSLHDALWSMANAAAAETANEHRPSYHRSYPDSKQLVSRRD